MSTALRPRPASVSRKPGSSWQPASSRGSVAPPGSGIDPDGPEAVPDQQQPVRCQQVRNRPPAVIWLQGREAGAEHGPRPSSRRTSCSRWLSASIRTTHCPIHGSTRPGRSPMATRSSAPPPFSHGSPGWHRGLACDEDGRKILNGRAGWLPDGRSKPQVGPVNRCSGRTAGSPLRTRSAGRGWHDSSRAAWSAPWERRLPGETCFIQKPWHRRAAGQHELDGPGRATSSLSPEPTEPTEP